MLSNISEKTQKHFMECRPNIPIYNVTATKCGKSLYWRKLKNRGENPIVKCLKSIGSIGPNCS